MYAAATMTQDFIAMEKHLVFFAPPLSVDPLWLLLGLDTLHGRLCLEASHGADVIRVPIDDPDIDSSRWFGELVRPRGSSCLEGELRRLALDPGLRLATSAPRGGHPCELPRLAPAVQGTRHAITGLAASDAPAGQPDRLHDVVAAPLRIPPEGGGGR
jgi:hypothetical protein